MNFSESTFVMPADSSGARRVRIFTPKHEMPMAGHPTVGTTWVLASRGEIALDSTSVDATLQLGIGPVTVTVESTRRQAGLRLDGASRAGVRRKRDDRERIAKALGITAADIRDDLPIQIVSTGFPFMFVPIRTLDALAKCAPNARGLAALFKPGEPVLPYICSSRTSRASSLRDRGCSRRTTELPKIPATGSAAAPFGAYAATYGLIKPAPKASFLIQQGVEMGRPSEIHVEVARKDERRVRNSYRRAMRDRRRRLDVPLARRRGYCWAHGRTPNSVGRREALPSSRSPTRPAWFAGSRRSGRGRYVRRRFLSRSLVTVLPPPVGGLLGSVSKISAPPAPSWLRSRLMTPRAPSLSARSSASNSRCYATPDAKW